MPALQPVIPPANSGYSELPIDRMRFYHADWSWQGPSRGDRSDHALEY